MPDHAAPIEYLHLQGDIAATHWWYHARRCWVAALLDGHLPQGARACDVGTGTGETLRTLADLGAEVQVGTELDESALRVAQVRFPGLHLVQSVAEQLPLRDSFFDCVTSMDVIEHLDDDRLALREYGRVLKPGSPVVITVPAYQQLWSDFDVRAGHRRRYTRRMLNDALVDAGFRVVRISYLFSFLAVPALILRKTPLRRYVGESDGGGAAAPWLNRALGWVSSVERWLAFKMRVPIPIGLSVIAIAYTPTES